MDNVSWKLFAGIECTAVAIAGTSFLLYRMGWKNGKDQIFGSSEIL